MFKKLAAMLAFASLAACANSIPKDTVFNQQADDAIIVLPNSTGHVLLASVDADTQTRTDDFWEYLSVSGNKFTVQRIPAGSYIFSSHSYTDHNANLRFSCLSVAAPVFEVKAGTVNLAPMVDPGIWMSGGPNVDPETWPAMADAALAEYPNVSAPVEEAQLIAVGIPIGGEGFSCLKDRYEPRSWTTLEN